MISCVVACTWLCFCGPLSAYAERPSVATVDWYVRHDWYAEPAADHVLVSVPNCGAVGWSGTMATAAGAVYPVTVFDCAGADGGHDAMIAGGLAGELHYKDWIAMPGLVGFGVPVAIEVRPVWNK